MPEPERGKEPPAIHTPPVPPHLTSWCKDHGASHWPVDELDKNIYFRMGDPRTNRAMNEAQYGERS